MTIVEIRLGIESILNVLFLKKPLWKFDLMEQGIMKFFIG
jgi:hypothetical protein